MSFRNGQWVKFSNEVPGGHQAADGKFVGIFVKGGTDGLGQKHADRVNAVDPKGCNIPVIVDGTIANVSFAPEDLVDAEPLLDDGDMPAVRKATMRDGFVLKP
jgi:hypothetical protein